MREQGPLDEVLAGLPGGVAVILHDVEMWWSRRPGGTVVIDRLLSLIEAHGDRIFFVLNLNVHAFRFIDRIVPLSDRALAVLECGPLDASALKEVITRRHASTGLRFELDGRLESTLGDWRQARLFSRYFDYAQGSVGVALRAWMVHIERFHQDRLMIRRPENFDHEVFFRLRVEWIALIVELILHREVTLTRLQTLSGLDPSTVASTVRTLQRMGLVLVDRHETVSLDPTAQHMVIQHLRSRGMVE